MSAYMLTERELAVLRLLGRGHTNRSIAKQMLIGEGTVKSHVHSILEKLSVPNREQAMLWALREGVATLYDS